MRREGIICVCVPAKRYNALNKKQQHKYNRINPTNQTVKQPYGCPNGGRNCSMCTRPELSGKTRRLERNRALHKHIRYDLSKD